MVEFHHIEEMVNTNESIFADLIYAPTVARQSHKEYVSPKLKLTLSLGNERLDLSFDQWILGFIVFFNTKSKQHLVVLVH